MTMQDYDGLKMTRQVETELFRTINYLLYMSNLSKVESYRILMDHADLYRTK